MSAVEKITVVGAGNVGATCANEIARQELAGEVVLVDIKEGLPQGKALDMWQTSPLQGFNTRIYGATNDYTITSGSEVVVITAGVPRGPGMSRETLIDTNARIIKAVTENILKYNPNPILIVVSNPLDVMTCAVCKAARNRLSSGRIFGMAGILDTARYKTFIAEKLTISPKSIHAILMGGHGDTMVPLPRYTTVSGIPISELLDDATLQDIIERTKKGGGELVNLIGTSAWYAPGAAAAQMVESVVRNQKRVFPVCARLTGEYGLKDIHLGVPVVLGKNGIEKIIELKLNKDEYALLHRSARAVREQLKKLDELGIFSPDETCNEAV
ncbi:MAG TPA: malate dehydrogenase [Bacteroidetes bacterium]|nr:malate dehydrogenase [Bacteroidota bacterium]